jgi:replicative DNA helicase
MIRISDILGDYLQTVTSGKRPKRWAAGPTFDNLELAPGRVLVVAGAPGIGKTAFLLAWITESLLRNPDLIGYVCNVEMDPGDLLHRIVSRLAGIELDKLIQNAVLPRYIGQLEAALDRIRQFAPRLLFGEPPFTLLQIAADVEVSDPGLLVIDYIQRIEVDPKLVPHTDDRTRLDGMMSTFRTIAQQDRCVIVISSISRPRNSAGQAKYSDSITQASLRGSAELEFAADDVAVLVPGKDLDSNADTWPLVLKHEKCRHGATRNKTLTFRRQVQEFA